MSGAVKVALAITDRMCPACAEILLEAAGRPVRKAEPREPGQAHGTYHATRPYEHGRNAAVEGAPAAASEPSAEPAPAPSEVGTGPGPGA